MSTITIAADFWRANREKTLATLDQIAALPDAAAVLVWRPGPGRAHIAWQLMHIGITEELFATERLVGSFPQWTQLVPRFRGGSTPDETAPSLEEISQVLDGSRQHLLETLSGFSDSDLDRVPSPLQERGWSLRKVLQILSWHEAHHQGQAHLTLNLWKSTTDVG